MFDGVTELRRPSHPVLSREHWSGDRASGSQRTTAPRRRPSDDGAAGAVRIRSRKPWTLARRRLFGWKVRLPLATTVSLVTSGSHGHRTTCASPRPGCRCLSSLEPARSRVPVAAVSPTFGRLFEGTEVACAGQTAPIRITRIGLRERTHVLALHLKPVKKPRAQIGNSLFASSPLNTNIANTLRL